MTKKTPEELYKERLKRIEDAIQLKTPDRVPILASFRYFPARYAGMVYEDIFYRPEEWIAANKKAIVDFEPDMYFPPITDPGRAYEILGLKQIKWPGHGIPSDASHQFVEDEYMKDDEYDEFIEDPTNYAIRKYQPRIYEAMESFKDLPSLDSLLFGYHSLPMLCAALARPEIAKTLEKFIEAGKEVTKTYAAAAGFEGEMKKLGFPATGMHTITAFDLISDMHRGMRGSMLDMYRRPEKLLKAIEKVEPLISRNAVAAARFSGNPRVFIPLHRGADGFMSDEQFRIFYWPSLKRLMITLIEEGLTPCPFFEGNVDSRLEYLRELPKGKAMVRFDTTDIFRAKEIIGDMICICGNMPVSMLQVGTPDDIKDHCKKMIDIAGKDGGFIMCSRSVLDESSPDNLKVWFDFTKKYGVYR